MLEILILYNILIINLLTFSQTIEFMEDCLSKLDYSAWRMQAGEKCIAVLWDRFRAAVDLDFADDHVFVYDIYYEVL